MHTAKQGQTQATGKNFNYCDVIMGAIASQITNLTIVYSTVHLGADQRKHQSSWSQAETYMLLKICAIVRCVRNDYLTFLGIDFEPLLIKLIRVQSVSR